MSIKVSIYEDNASLREKLTYLIEKSGSFELCVTSDSVENIMEDCQKQCPDVILMGIDNPVISGNIPLKNCPVYHSPKGSNEATMLVKNSFPNVNVMRLTVCEDIEKIIETLRVGATAILLKKTPPVKILNAIEELFHGGSPLSSVIARKVVELFAKPANSHQQDEYKLTKRERDVLQRLLLGDSYKMVADACCISIGTVYSHINNIYKKLQINSKSEAVIKAIQEGLVFPTGHYPS